jgi:hypothetical protein
VTREQFEHAIRAAGAVLGTDELLVIGSQAIHGADLATLPSLATRSVEVDLVPPDDPDGRKADLIDGSIGEGSMFHETYGYYAQGVGPETAVLPAGWRDRLLRYETPATNGVAAWCLEPHDLWISKAIAGRPKDVEFCGALLEGGLVRSDRLRERLEHVEGPDPRVLELAALIGG